MENEKPIIDLDTFLHIKLTRMTDDELREWFSINRLRLNDGTVLESK